MTRRLLFDQNLAPRLVDRVAAEFPGSLHVRDLGLHASSDAEVLLVAAQRDLVIVTKDKDFADLVTARSGGPKVLWLLLGNVSTDQIAESILAATDAIIRLLEDPTVQIVQLAGGGKPVNSARAIGASAKPPGPR